MSSTLSKPLRGQALFRKFWKLSLRRVIIPFCVFAPFTYFFPKIALFYAVCGAYDVGRNKGLNLSTLRRYFLGNGVLLWMLSPINVLLDLLSLPHINKGIYRLEDMPTGHQDEIKRLMKAANDADLVRQTEERSKEHKRAIILWLLWGPNRSNRGRPRLQRTVELHSNYRAFGLQQEDFNFFSLWMDARIVPCLVQHQ